MFSPGGYNSQSRQGPRRPPPPYLHHHSQAPPPPVSHNFQQGPLLPSPQIPPRPGQPGLPIYQHGPLSQNFGIRQIPPVGLSNEARPYLHRPPTVQGSAPLPRMYTNSQQNAQHSYLVPGPAAPPRSLPPTLPRGQTSYRAPNHQLPPQPGGVHCLQQIPPPQPPLPTSSFPTSAHSGSTSESTIGSSQMSSMAPLPLSSISTPLVPPSLPLPHTSPPPSSSTLSSYESDAPHPPKPAEDIVRKIEEFCQLIAKHGPSYEDMARQKETENSSFKFLFGGEPGSEAAIAHEYFLWMKRKYKLVGIEHAMPTNHLTVASGPHSPADSDMEMEDDITGSDIDQAVNQPFKGQTQPTVLKSSKNSEKQSHALPTSVVSDASTMVFSDTELCSGSLRPSTQGSKVFSNHDGSTSGRSFVGVQGLVSSAQDTEYPFVGDKENSSAWPTDDKKSFKIAGADERVSSDNYPGRVINGSSPFRLLQDYTSNDSSENDDDSCPKDSNPETVSSLVAVSNEWLATKHIDTKQNQLSIDHASEPKDLPKEDASGGEWTKAGFSSKNKNNEDKNAKFTSNTQKIDRFGRLVRESASDSDSDDSHHVRRHSKRVRNRSRSRSRSRSQSPMDRRRKRRGSPWRRRENRSRSRSWSPRNRSRSGSPRNQRSRSRSPRNRRSRSMSPRNRRRSKSPSFRHESEFSSGSMKRDKGQMQTCFDFLRGKCYRGVSCRYLHHDYEKNNGSRHHRSKWKKLSSSKNGSTHEDSKKFSLKESYHEQETVNHEMQHNHDLPTSSFLAAKDDFIVCNREDSVGKALVDSDKISSCSIREATAKVPETKVFKERSENATTCVDENYLEAEESDRPTVVDSFSSKLASDTKVLNSFGEASKVVFSSTKDFVIQQSRLVQSHPLLEDTDHPDQQSDDSSISDSSPDKTSATSPKNLHTNEALPILADSVHNPSQLPLLPPVPNSEDNNTQSVTQRDYSSMPRSIASQSHSVPLESFPSYMLPNQSSLFSVPSNSSSVSLPPPSLLPAHVPTANAGTAQPVVSSQCQQNCLPPRSDFGSQMFSRPPYSTELSGNFQFGEFQHRAYPPVQAPLLRVEDFSLKPPPGSNLSGQQFGSTSIFGEDCLTQLPVQGLNASDSFTRSNNFPQPMSSQELPATKMKSLPSESLPKGDILKSSFQIHPYLQQQQPCHDLHHSVPDSLYGLPGKISSSPRHPPDHQDRNQSLHLPDFGVTRSSAHFNPYASTFEKPLSSRFSSDVFRQEKDTTYGCKHDHSFSLTHTSIDGQVVGSRQATSSPAYTRGVGKIIPQSSGDQYDPLFDSLEPSSNLCKKSDHIQKWEPSGDSNTMLRLKGSNQALDVEENNRKKEVGSITPAASVDNEEFGETADVEVGDVEHGSQSNPGGLADTNMGEIEIDQIKSPGKSKKSKESRSMKLFKACLADFVKEVLKPSWRQGNMSKETFKTVVKKTVDKVAGAMKSHQIPKSKPKINQYIDSSQRKLTKLVMGYVDKYAKG